MKKFLLRAVAFLLFSSFLYIIFICLWGTFVPAGVSSNLQFRVGPLGHSLTRFQEVKNVDNLDLLFLGTSHTYRGFDTRIFKEAGYHSFNLGSSMQTPIQTRLLLKRYLEKLNPKVVVYEVWPFAFTADGVESSLDLMANDKIDKYSLDMAIELNHIKTYNALLYGGVRGLMNANESIKEPMVKGKDTYISGGYVEKEVGYYKPTSREGLEIVLNQSQVASFEENLAYIQSKNIELVLVYAPITNGLYQNVSHENDFDAMMSAYSEYYNFNEMLTVIDTLHFYDESHLSQKGVELFNSALIDILKSR